MVFKYNLISKKIILPIFLLLIMINSYQVSATTSLNVKVGDKLNYKITKLNDSIVVNGNEYLGNPTNYKVGDKVQVTVDKIGNSSTGQYVNVTESINKNDYKTSSLVNDWQNSFMGFYVLGDANLYIYPTYVDFSSPNISGGGTSTVSLIPYFATSNSSYYDSIIPQYQNTFKTDSFDTLTTTNNVNNHTFNFSFNLGISMTNSTSSGSASLTVKYIFKISIDELNSIVTNFYYYYHDAIKVGLQSKSNTFELGMQQDTSAGNGFLPFPSIWFSVISLFVAATIINRKRSKKY